MADTQKTDNDADIKDSVEGMPEIYRLIYVDRLMSYMRSLDGKTNVDKDYKRDLQGFIKSYMLLSKNVYGDNDAEAMQELVSKLDLKTDIRDNPQLLEQAKKLFPETQEIFNRIEKAQKAVASSQNKIGKRVSSHHEALGTLKEYQDLEAEITKKLKDTKGLKGKRKILGYGELDGQSYVEVSCEGEGLYDQSGKPVSRKVFSLQKLDASFVERMNALGSASNFISNRDSLKKGEKSVKTQAKNTKEAQKNIASGNIDINNLYLELNKTITQSLSENPKLLLLSLSPGTRRHNPELAAFVEQALDTDKIRLDLVENFQKDEKIWNYVKDADYYNLIKKVVGNDGDYDREAAKTYGSKELNELLRARAKIVDNLNFNKDKGIEDVDFEYQGRQYRVAYKPLAVEGKNNKNYNKELNEDAQENANSSRLGSLIEMLQSNTASKELYNDFKKHMGNDIDRFLESTKLSANKNNHISQFRELMQKHKIKVDIHHIKPRRLSACLDNSDPEAALAESKRTFNNKNNMAIMIQWKPWEQDPHQFLGHFSELVSSSANNIHLINKDNKVMRSGDVKGAATVYQEVLQVKDAAGNYKDAIPKDTLALTSSGVKSMNSGISAERDSNIR